MVYKEARDYEVQIGTEVEFQQSTSSCSQKAVFTALVKTLLYVINALLDVVLVKGFIITSDLSTTLHLHHS